MSARIVVRQCSDPRHHAIHVSDARRSMHAVEDDAVRYLCGGDRTGDRRIREAETLADLVTELDARCTAFGTGCGGTIGALGACSTCGAVPSLNNVPAQRRGPDPSLDVSEPYHNEVF